MKKILLLLADGFEILESSAFIDVMGWNLEEGDGSTRLFSCGLRKEIKSSFNQNFTVDFLIKDIEVGSHDALVIPGGFETYGYYKDAYNEKFLNVIREFNKENKIIASVCVGALPVAKSGILIGKNATTYNNKKRMQTLKEFGAKFMHKPIVQCDNIITSCGPSTAVDVSFLLLEMLSSIENTKKVRKLMGY